MKQIQLAHGMIAKIDDADFERVSQYHWWPRKPTRIWYAATRLNGWKSPIVYLHRFILNPPKGVRIDHKDLDGLNCQRENMRPANHRQNQWNKGRRKDQVRSQFKGVEPSGKKWKARICGQYIGLYETEEEAAQAYDQKAAALFGEFARPNFKP